MHIRWVIFANLVNSDDLAMFSLQGAEGGRVALCILSHVMLIFRVLSGGVVPRGAVCCN